MRHRAIFFFWILICFWAAAGPGATRPAAQPPGPAAPGAEADRSEKTVSINFEDVDINVFIRFISRASGKNFIVDRSVKGNVTIISPKEISVEEAWRVFESVLEVHGFTAVEAGEVTKIVPMPSARSKNIETRLRKESGRPEDRVITQIIPLKYAAPDEVKRLLTPLVSKNSVLLAYGPANMLIITDVASNIKRLLKILDAVDVMNIGRELAIIPVEYADVRNFAKTLGSVFPGIRPGQKGARAKTVRFIPDERTNSIIVMAGNEDAKRIKQLISILDVETPRGKGKIHVYTLENALAEDMEKALKNVSSQKGRSSKLGKSAPAIAGAVGISSDKATNSIVITADKSDYMVLEKVIRKLDAPRTMVYIECLIMEVRADMGSEIGVDWSGVGLLPEDILSENRKLGYKAGFGSKDPLAATSPGFALGLLADTITLGGLTFPNIGAMISAFQQDTSVNILSTPQILVMNNEEAKITVGESVPFATESNTDSGITTSSYEYKDVGITLKITPQISKDRAVRLKFSHELTKVKGVSATDYRPTTLKRAIETSVIVKDGKTVVIGGLIDEQIDAMETSVPCLGDLPLLGMLFKNFSKSDNKSNLFVFLTPHVIARAGEAGKIYRDKKEYMDEMKEKSIKMYKSKDKKRR
ncbi:Type II secretion system protein GspD [Candidatus Desulfarcum epimagneticum]|uniref:Type II secretion system protein GspD n=1 Tax=uncultured Desulfobacteraceae bacterium TaxID=218296 RepID=A0A484HHB2_9BACT|nr:Type II secretion system protein GspD [uncultured Desulfobacteraceae bacterium]